MEKKTFIITAAVTAVVVAGGLFIWRGAMLSRDEANALPLVNGLFESPVTVDGTTYLVPPGDIYDVGVAAESIPALTNPTFTDVATTDRLLADDVSGIDVVVNGDHRYYPDQIMNWHQVVNDTFNGQSIVVVHDPLSGTSVVYEHTGAFKASGKVYNNTMLMDDGAGSLWLASRGVAVVGESDVVGMELKQYPSRTMTWATWKELYANEEVLSAAGTGYTRDYTRHPYGDYGSTASVYFPLNNTDLRVAPKSLVLGLDIGGEQLAIPEDIMATTNVMSDVVGGVPITAFYDWQNKIVNIFSSSVSLAADDGESPGSVHTFIYDIGHDIYVDKETGSEWTSSGECVKGSLRGTQLTPINAPEYYWFAWAAVFPNTRVNPDATALVKTDATETDTTHE